MEERNSAHPLLRGGRAPYHHGFFSAEMESLQALCDTFIPSFNPYNSVYGNGHSSIIKGKFNSKFEAEAVQAFHDISGSQDVMSSHMAGLIAKHCPTSAVIFIRCILLFLSTALGTFLLCGRASLSRAFPYVRNFAAIPVNIREKILLRWSLGTGSFIDPLFQLIFKTFKTCCLYCFYSRADESGWNPSWKAIGYSPPYIPTPNEEKKALDCGIIDASAATTSKLQTFLADAGFDITTTNVRTKRKIERGSNTWKVKCDVVVVGSGAGGGVVAGKLAQAGYQVLVVEKGKYFAGGDLSLIEGPSMDQMYVRGGLLATGDAKVSILAGETVGGGSAINWSASIRTPPHVLREWANEHGLSLFQTEEYQRAISEVWTREGANSAWEKESFANMVLRKGCAALGYEVTDVCMNATPDHFCGSCGFGCRKTQKKGTADTWLVDAVAANARILGACEALEVTWTRTAWAGAGRKQKRASGVVCRAGGDYVLVEAKATVVACGALMTPVLLRASGLNNPNIGKNLHLHPVRMAWGYFPPEVEPHGRCYEGNIITAMCKEGSKWEESGYGAIIQTPAMPPGCFASVMPWISGADMKERMSKYDRTAHLFTLTRDRGSGSVGPSMDVDYRLKDPRDVQNLEESLERALRILIAAGATEVGTHHNDGRVLKVQGSHDHIQIEKYLQDLRNSKAWCPLISAHQMGTCRMGIDPATSCVDENGHSWDVEGLFVSDASVLPTALGVNPMITVQSIALCVSHRVSHFLQQTIISSLSSSLSSSCG